MSSTLSGTAPQKARKIPARHLVPGLLRDPIGTFENLAGLSGGQIVRLNLGPFRPYLVTHPDDVQYVLRDNVANFRREGMMWKPLSRLVGDASDVDPSWPLKVRTYQSLLSARSIASYGDQMAAAINEAVDELAERADPAQPLDAYAEMARIVYRAITRVLVGDRISLAEVDELGAAIGTATASSFRSRMLLPFVPNGIPLPGDRTFHRAVQKVDELVFPIIRECRRRGAEGDDIVSMLLRTRDADGTGLNDQQVRDGVVGLFVASTDTTVTALTFMWSVLDEHRHVAAKLLDELDQVVGVARPSSAHLPELNYTKQFMHELLRFYSVAWITPRTVANDDVLGGVQIKRGATLLLSPYLTHRLPDVWPDPEVFDPERFAPGQTRHRFAYMAFGGGPNQCVGRLFFFFEAPLIVAALTRRFRLELVNTPPIRPRLGLTLKPDERVELKIRAVERAPLPGKLS